MPSGRAAEVQVSELSTHHSQVGTGQPPTDRTDRALSRKGQRQERRGKKVGAKRAQRLTESILPVFVAEQRKRFVDRVVGAQRKPDHPFSFERLGTQVFAQGA